VKAPAPSSPQASGIFSIRCPECSHEFKLRVKHKSYPKSAITKFYIKLYQVRNYIAAVLLLFTFILGILSLSIGWCIDITSEPEATYGKKGMITGTVINSTSGLPIESARVTVLGTNYVATTNNHGWFIIYDVPVGKYRVQAVAEGYCSVVQHVYVTSSALRTTDFALHRLATTDNVEYLYTSNNIENPARAQHLVYFQIMTGLFACCALAAAALVVKKVKFSVAMICGACSILSIGFGIGSALALIALVIILSCKHEFIAGRGRHR
jgi:hypothetical protein